MNLNRSIYALRFSDVRATVVAMERLRSEWTEQLMPEIDRRETAQSSNRDETAYNYGPASILSA
jgi:hypothetical protein